MMLGSAELCLISSIVPKDGSEEVRLNYVHCWPSVNIRGILK